MSPALRAKQSTLERRMMEGFGAQGKIHFTVPSSYKESRIARDLP
tara:strand:- start:2188 stop:2322 length:135 start_codon:yes stop_codon:yes gene_type:complete